MELSDLLEIFLAIFVVVIVLVYVVPPLATNAIQNYPTYARTAENIAETVPKAVNQLCEANEKIEELKNKLSLDIINSIPIENEKVAIAKENLISLYNGINLTYEQIQTLNDIPKYYKLKLDIYHITNEIKKNPEIICNFMKSP